MLIKIFALFPRNINFFIVLLQPKSGKTIEATSKNDLNVFFHNYLVI